MALDAKYKTGILWQDFQHNQLITLFEKIQGAKTDKRLYQYTIAFLAMYVNHHFQLEEEYMKQYLYPDLSEHQQKHKKFVKDLKRFRAENKEFSEAGIEELLTCMRQWILDHILCEDKKLGDYILSV